MRNPPAILVIAMLLACSLPTQGVAAQSKNIPAAAPSGPSTVADPAVDTTDDLLAKLRTWLLAKELRHRQRAYVAYRNALIRAKSEKWANVLPSGGTREPLYQLQPMLAAFDDLATRVPPNLAPLPTDLVYANVRAFRGNGEPPTLLLPWLLLLRDSGRSEPELQWYLFEAFATHGIDVAAARQCLERVKTAVAEGVDAAFVFVPGHPIRCPDREQKAKVIATLLDQVGRRLQPNGGLPLLAVADATQEMLDARVREARRGQTEQPKREAERLRTWRKDVAPIERPDQPEADPASSPASPGRMLVLEGETLKVLSCSAGATEAQQLPGIGLSNRSHLWWREAAQGASLELAIPVVEAGTYRVAAVFCMAGDYGIVKISLGGLTLRERWDGYAPQVQPSKAIDLGTLQLTAGELPLRIDILDKNAAAEPRYMFGLDFVRLELLR